MQHIRLVLSSLALLGGVGILGLSLSTATAAQSSTGIYQASGRTFYLDREILPDHVGYPVLMAIDRIKLESAAPAERVYLQVEYGNRRLADAQRLLDSGDTALALTTATKGYKYFIHAAQETIDHDLSSAARTHVLKNLEFHGKEMDEFKTQFGDADRVILDQLSQEMSSLAERLK